MIENLIKHFLEQSPTTAAMIVLVLIFTKYIAKRDKSWESLHREEIKDHLMAREESRAAILSNTQAMMENTASNVRLIEKLNQMTAVCPLGKVDKEIEVLVKRKP